MEKRDREKKKDKERRTKEERRGQGEHKEKGRKKGGEYKRGVLLNFTISKQTAAVSEQHVHNRDGDLKCRTEHNDQVHDPHFVDVRLEKQANTISISQINEQTHMLL